MNGEGRRAEKLEIGIDSFSLMRMIMILKWTNYLFPSDCETILRERRHVSVIRIDSRHLYLSPFSHTIILYVRGRCRCNKVRCNTVQYMIFNTISLTVFFSVNPYGVGVVFPKVFHP